MKVTLKLYAGLADYLPPGCRDNRIDLEVADAANVASLIEAHQLPAKQVHLVLVNGVYVAPEERAGKVLQAGDQLAIWPPIAGG